MSTQPSGDAGYDLKSIKLPKLSGLPLRLISGLMESPFSGLVEKSLLSKSGVEWFRRQTFDDPPTQYPIHDSGKQSGLLKGKSAGDPVSPENKPETDFPLNTIGDYYRAYSSGETTPVDVAGRLLDAAAADDKTGRPLRAFIVLKREDLMKQAEESAERYKQGEPLSILDGVPVAIKDQFNLAGYPTTIGTSFLGKSPVKEDSSPAARLREAGALLAGKTGMHELGLGITGINPHHGTSRNPYNTGHQTGGSSGGSAAAVAAGLCPAAIGADGGGSIRIPAAFCGVVGLKPTFGRVSLHGDARLCWSVEHTGPITATAADAAIVYAAIAGPDENDPLTLGQPVPAISGWDNTDLRGLTLGICPQWFEHGNSSVVSTCAGLLQEMAKMGAEIREITIPGLEAGRVAHTVTIAAEIAHSVERYYAQYHGEFGLDVRLNLAMARKFTSSDYIKAQQVRTRMLGDFYGVFEEVDAIITPSTAIAAPPIPEKKLPGGESNLSELFEIMRFATPANLTGLPAITFPAGYTGGGLPVGMQAIAGAWQEKTLLRLAIAAEKTVKRKAPQVYYDLLRKS